MTYERDGRAARITLNRPERGNGITLEMPRELASCVERANLDPEVHLIALAGNGSGFCGGYDLVSSAEGRFEEGYILSREPNPVAAMCSYVCSAPCERACRRGDIDRPLAIRAMKRFLVEWHQASGIPDDMPNITPSDTTVAVQPSVPSRQK